MEENFEYSIPFILMSHDIIVKSEDKICRLLRTLKPSGAIPSATYNDIVLSASRTAILFGLTKIYKDYCSIRPIISAVGCFNHRVAKFLVSILSPLSMNKYAIRNSFSSLVEIRSLHFDPDVYMCSFVCPFSRMYRSLKQFEFVQMHLLTSFLPVL